MHPAPSLQPGETVASISVENFGRDAARGPWLCVVPFSRGKVGAAGDEEAATLGSLRLAQPGALILGWTPLTHWPDGTLRTARLAAACECPPGRSTIDLYVAAPDHVGRADGAPTPDLMPALAVQAGTVGSGIETVSFRFAAPFGSIWGRLHVLREPGSSLARYWMAWGYSDPRQSGLSFTAPTNLVYTLGTAMAYRHGIGSRQAPPPVSELRLLTEGQVVGDGQAYWDSGVVLLGASSAPPADQLAMLAQQHAPLCAVAQSWPEVPEAASPFGALPPLEPWLNTDGQARAYVEGLYTSLVLSLRNYDDPPRFGLKRNPGDAGHQEDFGAIRGGWGFWGLHPGYGWILSREACQEWRRPIHHREVDGQPIRSIDHPQMVGWNQRPHHNQGVSPDQLGKEAPTGSLRTGGWYGKDHEHYSVNYLATAFLLSGDPLLEDLLHEEAEDYLASVITSPPWPTIYHPAGPQAARAEGRRALGAAWILQCIDRYDLRQRLRERIKRTVLPAYVDRERGPVRPWYVRLGDGRQGGIPVGQEVWSPWQENILVIGMMAADRAGAGSGDLAGMIAEVADSAHVHGWALRGGAWIPSNWVAYLGPETPPNHQDPAQNNWGDMSPLWSAAVLVWVGNEGAMEALRPLIERERKAGATAPSDAAAWTCISEDAASHLRRWL